MIGYIRLSAAALLTFAATTQANDTFRLGGQPADRGEIKRLDIKASDEGSDDTERTCFRFGVRVYGGFGWYRPAVPVFAPAPVYIAPRIVYRAPVCFPAPIVYRVPRVIYRIPPVIVAPAPVLYAPVVTYGAVVPITTNGEEPAAIEESKTFRYDGDRGAAPPVERIPPARNNAEPPEVPELPKAPTVPKLGPAPTERMVVIPARSTTKRYAYPAYGEERMQKPARRDDRGLLIRRDR